MSRLARIARPTLLLFCAAASTAVAGEEPEWGLPRRLADDLARSAENYAVRYPERVHVGTIRGFKYRPTTLRAMREPDPFREPYGARSIPELRFQTEPPGRARKRLPRRVKRFPTAHDWARLFSVDNQPLFMYRLLDRRMESFDLVLEIQFRGWIPFTDGADIREWEGIALVEATRLELVEVRAQPRNQDARLAWRFDRWSRAFKITLGLFAGPFFIPAKTFRLARTPLAYRCFARFDVRDAGARLPSFVRYEVRRAISRRHTVRHSVATLHYTEPDRFCATSVQSASPAAGDDTAPLPDPGCS